MLIQSVNAMTIVKSILNAQCFVDSLNKRVDTINLNLDVLCVGVYANLVIREYNVFSLKELLNKEIAKYEMVYLFDISDIGLRENFRADNVSIDCTKDIFGNKVGIGDIVCLLWSYDLTCGIVVGDSQIFTQEYTIETMGPAFILKLKRELDFIDLVDIYQKLSHKTVKHREYNIGDVYISHNNINTKLFLYLGMCDLDIIYKSCNDDIQLNLERVEWFDLVDVRKHRELFIALLEDKDCEDTVFMQELFDRFVLFNEFVTDQTSYNADTLGFKKEVMPNFYLGNIVNYNKYRFSLNGLEVKVKYAK